jgi:sulfite reductase (NADPH) flavoprotein alpha-component
VTLGDFDVTAATIVPKTAPFPPEDIEALNRIVARATSQQRTWLAGFLAGLDAAQGHGAVAVAAPKVKAPLTILYGSESGNAEGLALKAKKSATKLGFDAKVVDMGDIDVATLAKSQNVLVYVSTWGEGDAPQRAVDFVAALMSDAAPRLDHVRFAVLALGDTAYAQFCATGIAIDARLEALGAKRAADRIDLDLDFSKSATVWTDGALARLVPAEQSKVVHVDFKSVGVSSDEDEVVFTADQPLEAEI